MYEFPDCPRFTLNRVLWSCFLKLLRTPLNVLLPFQKLSISMHLISGINGMLDFIWTLPVGLRGTRNKWTFQEILSTNTARPPDYKPTVINTRPQLAWYEWMIFIYIRSINKRVNLYRYTGSTWCTCFLP